MKCEWLVVIYIYTIYYNVILYIMLYMTTVSQLYTITTVTGQHSLANKGQHSIQRLAQFTGYLKQFIHNYNGLHEIKTKNRKLNSHQDLSNNSVITSCYHEKESTNQEIIILSNIISSNIYNNLHHFGNDITVQVDKGNTKTKQIQHISTVRRS